MFGVGDDDQTIYGYAGATPDYLVRFDDWFPGATHHALETNYRCPPAVVTAAGTLLTHNRVRVDKTIHPAPGREPVDGELVVRRAPATALAAETVDVVTAWLADGAAPTDVAVLARVNVALAAVQIALGAAGVPVECVVDRSLLERTGVTAALAWLRVALDPYEIRAPDLVATIRRPGRKLSNKVVEWLTQRGTTDVHDIRRLGTKLGGRDEKKLAGFADDIERLARRASHGGTTATLLRSVRVDIGLGQAMDVLDASRREPDRSTHTDDLLALEQVAACSPIPAASRNGLRTSSPLAGRRTTAPVCGCPPCTG